MKKVLIGLSIFVLISLLIGGCVSSKYNTIVTKDELVKNAWGAVQTDYQRRSDLIPNLVQTVQGEASFEKSTLTEVIAARASATQMKIDASTLTPEKLQQFQAAQGQIGAALGRLMVVSEKYPQLQANQAFRDLASSIEGTENRIKVSRNGFNDATKDYNMAIRQFPMNLFAGMFGYKEKPYFEADKGSEKAPKVEFSFDKK